MPTSAATGTEQVSTAGRKPRKQAATTDDIPTPDLSGQEGYVQPDAGDAHDLVDGSGPAPDVPKPEAQPLADPSGNGTIQVTNTDGSTTNIDGCDTDWEDQVRAINPKHGALPKSKV